MHQLRGRRRPRRPHAAWLAVAASLVVLLAACSSGSDSSESTTDSGGAAAPEAGTDDRAGAESGGQGGDSDVGGDAGTGITGTDAPATGDERKIRRGTVTIRVDDLTETAAQIRDAAAGLGGYVSDESIGLAAGAEPGDGLFSSAPSDVDVAGSADVNGSAPELAPYYGPGEGRLVVRVPTESMQEAMDTFAALGTELSRWSSETTVERALVDLESRVKTQTASVERVRALLASATSLSDIVTLESELAKREAELESLKAQLDSLAGRAAMATVTVIMRTPDRTAQIDDERGFLGGLRAGWRALQESTVVLLTIIGALLPFAMVVALAAVPFLMWRRRVRDRRPHTPGGVPASVQTGPGWSPPQQQPPHP